MTILGIGAPPKCRVVDGNSDHTHGSVQEVGMLQKLLAQKSPNPTDRHVGSRVRMRRKVLSLSQTKLAEAIWPAAGSVDTRLS